MNIAVARNFNAVETIDDGHSSIHQFFEKYRDALRNAARLLGGREAINLVDEIIDALSRNHPLARRTIECLHKLEGILALDYVGDPYRAESGYFAEIDIFDPVVEEICFLTDGLRSAVASLPEHPGHLRAGPRCEVSGNVARWRTWPSEPVSFPAFGEGDAQ